MSETPAFFPDRYAAEQPDKPAYVMAGSGQTVSYRQLVERSRRAAHAMRALGTDPVRKLVAPRIIALLVTLPLLTVLADCVGIAGGAFAATSLYGLSTAEFFTSVQEGITADDIIGGVIKPICFAFIIGSIACYKGLTTEGGTVGVGRSTTRAVVSASIVVIISDFFLARALQYILGMPAG